MPVSYSFPLEGDLPGAPTQLTLEGHSAAPTPDDRASGVVVRLSGSLDDLLVLPMGYRVGRSYSRPETLLAIIGSFLSDLRLAVVEAGVSDGLHPWPFDALPHDAWLLHVRQLVALEERLAAARRTPVADDPRVQAAMRDAAEAATPHVEALSAWLDASRPQVKRALAMLREDGHERMVAQVVLDLLGSHEDETARPNPDLPRLAGDSANEPSQGSER
ncbi:hypothetical protein [Ornithinimicrobium sp. Y1694]|uniref:hypothetical protein n=1 Tax=Ornithinimicrobium sp. Y1694 TaxID=3418590 RepID=UPI003CE8B0B9